MLVWGYLQYLLVGRYRLPRAGGSWGIDVPPDRIVATGPYRYTRNPMYLGHLIFMLGLTVTFWSWFALVLLAARAIWFHRRVLEHFTIRLTISGAGEVCRTLTWGELREARAYDRPQALD